MTMLRSGFDILSRQMERFNGEPIIYRRGDLSTTVHAVRGRTQFEEDEAGGELRVQTKSVDWIIRRELLVLGGQLTEPQKGDVIEAAGQQYELLSGSAASSWTWTNSYQIAYRIHTQRRLSRVPSSAGRPVRPV